MDSFASVITLLFPDDVSVHRRTFSAPKMHPVLRGWQLDETAQGRRHSVICCTVACSQRLGPEMKFS